MNFPKDLAKDEACEEMFAIIEEAITASEEQKLSLIWVTLKLQKRM